MAGYEEFMGLKIETKVTLGIKSITQEHKWRGTGFKFVFVIRT